MAKQPGEARLEFLLGEEALGLAPGLLLVLIEQFPGCVQQKVSGGHSGMDGEEFESGTLVVIEFDHHEIRVRVGGKRFNGIKVTSGVIWRVVTHFGKG